jgi:hypothetical protein
MQILIAHRGNINGPNPEKENTPDYIDEAILADYDVEIDVWVINNEIYLGHDAPDTLIELNFLTERSMWLWCHAKNLDALVLLLKHRLHTFSHDTDDYILTSKSIIWAYPGKKITSDTICVMPERSQNYTSNDILNAKGICSDYIANYLNF